MFRYKASEKVELKTKLNNDEITKEIVAFLNSRGGTIFVGVTDSGEIVGVEKIDESLRRLIERYKIKLIAIEPNITYNN